MGEDEPNPTGYMFLPSTNRPNSPLPDSSHRLSMPFQTRICSASSVAIATGGVLGYVKGLRATKLRFRAENAHRMPTSASGWYVYHKHRNGAAFRGGLREGWQMGCRLGVWTALFFGFEELADRYRGPPHINVLHTCYASLTVATLFSIWNRLPLMAFVRITSKAVLFGGVYGLCQDLVSVSRGREIGHCAPCIYDRKATIFQLPDDVLCVGLLPNCAKMLSLWPNGIRCWSRVMPSSHVRPQLNIRSIQVSPPRPTARQASTPHHLQESPYAAIPLSLLLRSLVTASFISSPRLMPIALFILSRLAYSNKPFWSPDTNPLLRYTLKHTIYRQFCAGENPGEVTRTIQTLKYLGFSGVMLSYSKEFEFSVEDTRPAAASPSKNGESAQSMDEERIWMDGNLRSVELAQPHDFVALKLTGAGRKTGLQLANGLPPTGEICGAIDVICSLAAKRGAKIVFDAEQAAVQSAINDLALTFMRKFNLDPSRPIVYLTYQAYLKATPDLLSKHLMAARDGQFSLGVKLVRGAYLDSDPRHSIHETKADTDRAFNGLAVGVLMQKWTDMLVGHGDFPTVSLVLATHNQNDVELAQSIVKAGKAKSHLSYAQLQGMADEVSFGLLKAAAKDTGTLRTETPEVYKYIAWGSVGDCLKYLLRRAEENRDAIQRVRRSRDAIWSELFRRLRAAVRLAPSS